VDRRAVQPVCILPPGRLRGKPSLRPVAALRLDPVLIAELRSLGFRHVAALLSQPSARLTRQFGPQLWRRIDQALGATSEPVDPIRLADVVEASKRSRNRTEKPRR